MRIKTTLLLLLVFLSKHASSQVLCGSIAIPSHQYFETLAPDPMDEEFYYEIDSLDTLNVWQVCAPVKPIISYPYSAPRVIITDSVNSYPINDTSVFELVHVVQMYMGSFEGYYFANSSVQDYCKLEYSPNNGSNWFVLNDVASGPYHYWLTPLTSFSGNTGGAWDYFQVSVYGFTPAFGIMIGDTVRFKFTFMSDSIPETLDGLAFDNFRICDGIEGVEEYGAPEDNISLFPNPATNKITFNSKKNNISNLEIRVSDLTGRTIIDLKNQYLVTGGEINLSSFNAGTYCISFKNEDFNETHIFIKTE